MLTDGTGYTTLKILGFFFKSLLLDIITCIGNNVLYTYVPILKLFYSGAPAARRAAKRSPIPI